LNSQESFTAPAIVAPGKVGTGEATCPTGTVATGGGFFVNGPVKTNIVASFPLATTPLKGWVVEAFNPTPNNAKFQTFVVCTSIMLK